MKHKAMSLILITVVIMVWPMLSVAKTSSQLRHGADAVSGVSHHGHHGHESDDASHHHSRHICCHGYAQLGSVVACFTYSPYFSLREQHGTEYRFVVTTTSVLPELRPPVV